MKIKELQNLLVAIKNKNELLDTAYLTLNIGEEAVNVVDLDLENGIIKLGVEEAQEEVEEETPEEEPEWEEVEED